MLHPGRVAEARRATVSKLLVLLSPPVGATVVFPRPLARKTLIPHDAALYKLRNQVERCFNRRKQFRRFATRYDLLPRHFQAFTDIAAAINWMR